MIGDEAEVAAFCLREHPRLVAALTLYSGDDALAEQLAHAALVRVVDDWPRTRRLAAPEAWLHRVGMQLADSWWARRSAGRWARSRVPDGLEDVPDEELANRIAVRRAMALIPRRQRQALLLRAVADCSLADAAGALRLQPHTVASLTSAALVHLRAHLGEYWPAPPPRPQPAPVEDTTPPPVPEPDDHTLWRPQPVAPPPRNGAA